MDTKKCNRCDKDLPIDKFEIYSGERGKTNLRSSRSSYCKECSSETRLINLLKKKYYIIETIFLKNNNKSDFKVSDLVSLLNQDKRSIRYYLDRLISLFYLDKTQESIFPFGNNYRVTDLGGTILEELKDFYQKTFNRLKTDITSMEDYMIRQNRWIN